MPAHCHQCRTTPIFLLSPTSTHLPTLDSTHVRLFFWRSTANITHSRADENSILPPLIVYLPNHPYTDMSNTSTMEMRYDTEYRDAIIENGYHVATMGNGVVDQEWVACAGCAIVRRGEEEKRGLDQTDQCKRCFTKVLLGWNQKRDRSRRGGVFSVNCTETHSGQEWSRWIEGNRNCRCHCGSHVKEIFISFFQFFFHLVFFYIIARIWRPIRLVN